MPAEPSPGVHLHLWSCGHSTHQASIHSLAHLSLRPLPRLQAMVERAKLVWAALEPLTDTDPSAEQFVPFAFV